MSGWERCTEEVCTYREYDPEKIASGCPFHPEAPLIPVPNPPPAPPPGESVRIA